MCIKRQKSTYLFLPSRLWLLCKAARRRWCWLCSSDMRALCSFISSLVLRWCFLTSSFISLYCFLCSRTKPFCCFSSSRVWASSSRKHRRKKKNYGHFWDNIHSSTNAHKGLKMPFLPVRTLWMISSVLTVGFNEPDHQKQVNTFGRQFNESFSDTMSLNFHKFVQAWPVFLLFQKNENQDLHGRL